MVGENEFVQRLFVQMDECRRWLSVSGHDNVLVSQRVEDSGRIDLQIT